MNYENKVQLTAMMTAPSDQAEEGDRTFRATPPGWRLRITVLVRSSSELYRFQGAELSMPWIQVRADGNTCFILTEYYESELFASTTCSSPEAGKTSRFDAVVG